MIKVQQEVKNGAMGDGFPFDLKIKFVSFELTSRATKSKYLRNYF